ncbi:MAG: AbrB/MazE/SpoVT family DNA-binding domain-containing protein [Bryobacteraceae bacterium]|jgi:AbrB family looped-hinge helix DNA binding protein
MPIVTVKNKYQVVIPRQVRDKIGVAVGDVFEAKAENGKIVFEPKSIIDRGIAESMAEFKAGHSFGPFATHKQFLGALHKEAKKNASKKPKR